MKEKGNHKIDKIKVLKWVNLLLLFVFVVSYVVRFIYCYKNQFKTTNKKNVTLTEKILQNESLIDLTKGLVKLEDNSYAFKGNSTNNYLLIGNRLYRILAINNDNTIRLISSSVETIMFTGLEKKYDSSYIKNWLNNIYLNSLPQDILVNSYSCLDNVNDINKITCENKVQSDYISLLSLYEYNLSGGTNSFLKDKSFVTLTSSNKGNYNILEDGSTSIVSPSMSVASIRPIITLKNNTSYISGNGTINNPFVAYKNTATNLKGTLVGDYVTLDNYTFKIVTNGDNTKVVLDGYVTKDNKEVTSIFTKSSSEYSLNNGVGYYLNNDFYNNFKSKNYLVKGVWNIGKLTLNNLSYQILASKTITSYVGLLNISDLYVSEYSDTFTLTRAYEDDKLIYVTKENNTLYSDIYSNSHKIRPAIYLNNNLIIKSGTGSKDNPYMLVGETDEN